MFCTTRIFTFFPVTPCSSTQPVLSIFCLNSVQFYLLCYWLPLVKPKYTSAPVFVTCVQYQFVLLTREPRPGLLQLCMFTPFLVASTYNTGLHDGPSCIQVHSSYATLIN